MNQTMLAIERVADKRHARLCAEMPERQAAKLIVRYLESMQRVHKELPRLVEFIGALKSGYSATV